MLKTQGSLIDVSGIVSGTSKGGKDWSKREFVIETNDQFPKKICFTLFGDKADLIDGVALGETITVSFDVESREFNGKWYHNVNANGIESSVTNTNKSTNNAASKYPPVMEDRVEKKEDSTEDVDELPF